MNIYDTAHRLANELRQTEAYQAYTQAQADIEQDETNAALLKEYRRLQMALQLRAAGGMEQNAEDMQRFSQLSTLLMMNTDIAAYLMAEMRVQRLLADLMKILTDAAGVQYEIP